MDKGCFEDPGSRLVGGPSGWSQNLSRHLKKNNTSYLGLPSEGGSRYDGERKSEEVERGREEAGAAQPAKKLLK